MRARRTCTIVSLLALSTFAASCATSRPSAGESVVKSAATPADSAAAADSAIELRVENEHWTAVRIFVQHDGQRTRVGTVDAINRRSFTLKPHLIGQIGAIVLIASPVAEPRQLSSDPVTVKPGQLITWTLEKSLARSSVAVR